MEGLLAVGAGHDRAGRVSKSVLRSEFLIAMEVGDYQVQQEVLMSKFQSLFRQEASYLVDCDLRQMAPSDLLGYDFACHTHTGAGGRLEKVKLFGADSFFYTPSL